MLPPPFLEIEVFRISETHKTHTHTTNAVCCGVLQYGTVAFDKHNHSEGPCVCEKIIYKRISETHKTHAHTTNTNARQTARLPSTSCMQHLSTMHTARFGISEIFDLSRSACVHSVYRKRTRNSITLILIPRARFQHHTYREIWDLRMSTKIPIPHVTLQHAQCEIQNFWITYTHLHGVERSTKNHLPALHITLKRYVFRIFESVLYKHTHTYIYMCIYTYIYIYEYVCIISYTDTQRQMKRRTPKSCPPHHSAAISGFSEILNHLYANVCVHICIHIHIYIHIHVYICIYTCIYLYVYQYTYIHMYVHICILKYIYVHIYIHIYIYMYTYIYIYTCTYIYIYIHVIHSGLQHLQHMFKLIYMYFIYIYIFI